MKKKDMNNLIKEFTNMYNQLTDDEKMINRWERIGFLSDIADNEKLAFSQNLEKTLKYLIKDNNQNINKYSDKFNVMIFLLVYNLTKKRYNLTKNHNFNIESVILDFYDDFIIDGYDLTSENDEDVKYIRNFIDNYEFFET